MRYRFLFFITAMALCLGGAARAAAPPTFLPEVLLMKSTHDGGEQWFEYAKLTPAVTNGAKPTVTFRYRADIDVVTCTIEAEATDATGAVVVKVTIQRAGSDPAGNPTSSTTAQGFKFTPGKALIVSTNPRILPDGTGKNVEILQLTLQK